MSDLPDGPTIEQCLSIMVVQLQRIYDIQLVLLALQDREAYENLITKHGKFEGVGPEPWAEE
jgi:hypothetical protein